MLPSSYVLSGPKSLFAALLRPSIHSIDREHCNKQGFVLRPMTEPYVYVRSLMFLLSWGSPGETGWSEVLGTSEWDPKIKCCLHERAILGFKKRSDDGTGNNRRPISEEQNWIPSQPIIFIVTFSKVKELSKKYVYSLVE